MARVGIELRGLTETTRRVAQLATQARPVLASALFQVGETIMTDSKLHYVPVDTGNLRSTGHVETPTTVGRIIQVVLGYGGTAARYAWRVHENPRSGHTRGLSPRGQRYRHWAAFGGWKYLELPFNSGVRQLDARLAEAVSRLLTR